VVGSPGAVDNQRWLVVAVEQDIEPAGHAVQGAGVCCSSQGHKQYRDVRQQAETLQGGRHTLTTMHRCRGVLHYDS